MKKSFIATGILGMMVLLMVKAPLAEGADFLADLHGGRQVTCNACHGDKIPAQGAIVANDRCLACHGDDEKLKKKATPPTAASPDPHFSHLGEIDCTLCHRGHTQSRVYCMECHKTFTMKLPGTLK